ncbi:MAG TPA: NnrS family protein [Polyangiaceae bacterium]
MWSWFARALRGVDLAAAWEVAETLRPSFSERFLLRPSEGHTSVRAPLPCLRKGFRPFFWLAAVFAIAIVPTWLLILGGKLQATSYLDATSWHAHEMVFGFVVAVIAGFLLTAVGNWTQRETAIGMPLLALAGLWLAGRLAMACSAALPAGVVAVADLAFLPALFIALARPVISAKNRRNYVILGVVAAFFVANLWLHLTALGISSAGSARQPSLIGVDLVVLLITIILGRVLPMFTRNAVGATSVRAIPLLDKCAIGSVAALCLADALAPATSVAGAVAVLAGLFSLARASHWGARHSLQQPLLWILHAGQAWLVVGLLLRGAALLGAPALASPAMHALTVGAIGSLTLGMMARVALGHTGRLLTVPKSIAVAFLALNLAALVRVLVPLLAPAWYFAGLVATATLWVTAFAIFVVVYTPILASPRVDGKPG